MPDAVKKDFGGALHAVQEGRAPVGAKALKGKIKGAMQISEDHDGEAYRAVYAVALEDAVYVLHCFHKTSKSGIATSGADVDLIESRLKDARALHAQRTRRPS
jgi:phage-related protein